MTAPHLLVLARIGAAFAIFALLTIAPDGPFPVLAALGLFLFGVATDIADGNLARRQGSVSNLGAFLDALADKLLVFSALLPWFGLSAAAAALIGTLVARDLAVLALRAGLLARGVGLPASRLAKLKTALLYAACGLLLVSMATFAGLAMVIGMGLLAAGTFVALASAVEYARRWRDLYA